MGGPVTNLDLLYCPREPAETVPTERVLETEGASLQKASEIALPYISLSLVLETMRAGPSGRWKSCAGGRGERCYGCCPRFDSARAAKTSWSEVCGNSAYHSPTASKLGGISGHTISSARF